eukprot:CAMPEP_0181409570 /NCGR_PEP_ID=MMETSP1110-20121109/6886_1 /TAXON_ID=174948 /ORGANISM="Symbiodinium sp., Strain CCMP421" /LENGTH=51 /DNA_ID=CAMNT_0023532079 /DNA_START=224 /DNA_END=379 /DNA_ORIENTATION=-
MKKFWKKIAVDGSSGVVLKLRWRPLSRIRGSTCGRAMSESSPRGACGRKAK